MTAAANTRGPVFHHYTCDHHVDSIRASGTVLPGSLLHPDGCPLAWFTTMARPAAHALGLTRYGITCDRTAHRFTVTNPAPITRWAQWAAHNHQHHRHYIAELEAAPGAQPALWWVATQPVDVIETTGRDLDALGRPI